MTYQNYEFTAFSEADFGVGNVGCGDTFTMPASATTCFNVSDNDPYLSGDCYDKSADHYGQHAAIEGDNGEVGNGGQIYAEKYFWVSDQDGNWYVMIEIEQEGSNDDYFTFYTGGGYSVPAEGAVLTVGNGCNVGQNNTWLDMKCLDAGDKVEPVPTGAICGRLTEDADCDNTEAAADGGYDEGLGGQTVELYGWNGSSSYLVSTTTTNADGSYDFPELEGGWYYVQFPEIDGGEFAAQGVGVEHADSDANAHGRTDWICLEDGQVQLNIDASVKFPVETGSISGTVFCDTDCDGLNGQEVVIEGCDYTIEAEHMQKYGFKTVSGTEASADCLVKLKCAGGWGDLTTTFAGKTGVYDVKIRVQDEDDGQSIIKLKVDGQLVEAIRLDADSDGGGSDNGGFSTYVIKDVSIASGEDIMLWADGDGNEFVRIDKIDLEGKDVVVSEGEPTKAGVEIKLIGADGSVIETTHTDADGNYAFNDIPVGDYTIMGVAPDGTEFTIQDAGSDDTIDSDVDANGMSGTVTVTADGNADVDLGVCEKPELGSIAGTYFCDENDNDVQDTGEAILAGQTVWLLNAAGTVIKTTTTDGSGNYIFDELEAGSYSVRFDGNNNGGKSFVDANDPNGNGDDTNDSDVVSVGGAGNGNTGTITLGAGENVTDVDAGVEDPGTAVIEGRVFCDENNNDVEDAGDAAVPGVTVELLDGAGDPVLDGNGDAITATTDGNGDYAFTGLDAGDYQVRFPTVVAGKTLVDANDPNGNGDDTNDSDADTGTGTTGTITVGIGETSSDNDAGVEDPATASLGGRIFMDSDNDNDDNNNGDEAAAPGVTVRLLDGNGDPILDANGDEVVAVTDANGEYLFENLPAGDYKVDFPLEVGGKVLVDQDAGASDLSDSDASQTTGETGTYTLAIGDAVRDVDAGVEDPGTASIEGRLFCDSDDDNQDNNNGDEVGVGGVTVELLDSNGDPVLDGNGDAVTTTTDGNGDYSFDGLGAGDYAVRFPTVVDGKVLVNSNDGPDVSDSDADQTTGETGTITVGIGETSSDNDAGVEDPGTASLAGRVFIDSDGDNDDNNNGDEAGLGGVTIKLVDAAGDPILDSNGDAITTETAADGSYIFTGLDAGDYAVMVDVNDPDLGGRVLVTQDAGASDLSDSDVDAGGMSQVVTLNIGDAVTDVDAGVEDPAGSAITGRVFCDENNNDVEDAGDAAVPGVTVELLDGAGNPVLDGNGDPVTAVTDGNGDYAFTGLDAGDYQVRFPTVVAGKTLVDANDPNGNGDDTNDSDADTGTGTTGVITVGINETSENNDAGVEDPGTASLEGRFFMDLDKSDTESAGDTAVVGATVELLDGNGDPVLDGNGDAVTTTTDGNGDYAFTGLDAGNYQVRFTNPGDKVFVAPNQGGDETTDSDAVDNNDGTATTGTITLNIGDNSTDNDAGIVDPGTAAIGDRVFLDANGNGRQDAGEDGVAGVDVIVRDANGAIAGTATTDGNGDYLVTGLDAGDYTVEFEEIDGFDFTTANATGVDDALDSDANQTTGITGTVNLDIGETDLTVDAGLVAENADPDAMDDTGAVCATEATTINVLANDTDSDGGTPAIATVNGEVLNVGDATILASGATVTLLAGGELSYDSTGATLGGMAVTDIVLGQMATDSFSYTITDGQGGTAQAEVSVTVKGGLNTIETILSSAPTSGSAVFSGFSFNSAYSAVLSVTGDARYDGLTIDAAYCLERNDDFLSDINVTLDISGALDSLQTASDFSSDVVGNLDLINWIINQDFTSQDNGDGTSTNYTDAEVQSAIWGITDGDATIFENPLNGTQENVDTILQMAIDNGEGYVPGEGDLFTLVLNPTEVQAGADEASDFDQAFIIALPFDDFKEDCIC